MEAGPRLHPVTQRPLTAAPADLHRLPADPRSAAGRQAAQAAAVLGGCESTGRREGRRDDTIVSQF